MKGLKCAFLSGKLDIYVDKYKRRSHAITVVNIKII